jgi:hypothetical protein
MDAVTDTETDESIHDSLGIGVTDDGSLKAGDSVRISEGSAVFVRVSIGDVEAARVVDRAGEPEGSSENTADPEKNEDTVGRGVRVSLLDRDATIDRHGVAVLTIDREIIPVDEVDSDVKRDADAAARIDNDDAAL